MSLRTINLSDQWPFGLLTIRTYGMIFDQWPFGLPTCRTFDHSDQCTIFGPMNRRTNDHSEYRAVPQIRAKHIKVSVDEIAWFLVYRMDVTRSQLRANDGIRVCLVWETWQFKSFRGEGGNCASRDPRGRRLLTVRKKVTVLVLKLNSFVFFKTLEITWLRTYHWLVIRTSKHI